MITLLFSLVACTPEEDSKPVVDDSGTTTDDTGGGDDTGAPAENARIRVLHLSPDAPAVDVFANGEGPVVDGLSFPNGSDYLTVPVGSYTFDVAPDGGSAMDAVLSFENVALEKDKAYTAIAYGAVASIAGMALVDSSDGLAATNIRITVAHTAAGIGEVDIWNLTGDTPSPLLENVPYGTSATLPDLPAAAYRVGFDVNNDANPDVSFAIPQLPGGTQVNLFAVNDAEGSPFLIAQLPDSSTVRIDPEPPPQAANLRVLHLSPDAPNVDIFVNGDPTAAISNLSFLSGTSYSPLPGASYAFDIAPAGAGISSSVLNIPSLALTGGEYYSAVAYGRVSALTAMALSDDSRGLAADRIRVQVAHTAAAVGEVDIWNITGGQASPLLENVPFGASAVLPDLPVAAYEVGIDANNDGSPDLTYSIPELPGGTFVNLFAVSDADDQVWLVAWLPDGSVVPISANMF